MEGARYEGEKVLPVANFICRIHRLVEKAGRSCPFLGCNRKVRLLTGHIPVSWRITEKSACSEYSGVSNRIHSMPSDDTEKSARLHDRRSVRVSKRTHSRA